MTWVHEPPPRATPHKCDQPEHANVPLSWVGKIWRCYCGKLWRVTTYISDYDGSRIVVWRRAWWWQRIKYRREGRA